MAVLANEFIGGYDVYCNDCGVKLCWSINDIEYFERQEFWDNYRCEMCDPKAPGAWLKANPDRTPFHGVQAK